MKSSKHPILRSIFTDEEEKTDRNERFSFSGNTDKKQIHAPKKFLSIKYRK
jgi:hypothetical protein